MASRRAKSWKLELDQCCYALYVTIGVLRVEVQIVNDIKYACECKNESALHIDNGLKSETPEPWRAGCLTMGDVDCCMWILYPPLPLPHEHIAESSWLQTFAAGMTTHAHTHTPTHTGSAKLFNTVATCRAETSFDRFTGVTSSLYVPWTAMVEHEDCQWPAATLTAREKENLLCKWCFSSCPAVY